MTFFDSSVLLRLFIRTVLAFGAYFLFIRFLCGFLGVGKRSDDIRGCLKGSPKYDRQ
jgi:hypothetical protein